ncbi:MAG: agmatinase [Clostridiales bacterium]|jgi:agmatinase|nr:agmatinase [Clostridiales bacterium]
MPLTPFERQPEYFIGCDKTYAGADIILFGAPFDGTASFRPGARFAPAVLRRESWGLETFSPYQDRGMSQARAHDAGDLDLPFGSPARAVGMVRDAVSRIAADGKRPFMIGGEHLLTLGAVQALADIYPDLRLLHFDAHADLRDEYLGEKLSHATVMRRIWEILGDGRIFQFGIRSGKRSEFEFADAHTDLRKFDLIGVNEVCASLAPYPVYVTIDLDVLDPSVFPGTGTPEPGGVSVDNLIFSRFGLRKLGKGAPRAGVVGIDAMELSPPYDFSGISAAAAGKVVREMVIALSGRG